MKRYDVLTLFPDMIHATMNVSIIGRAKKAGHLMVNCHQIRDFTTNKQRQVDDYPFGGGMGLVMQADPLYRAWQHVVAQSPVKPHTIFMSPTGKPFHQTDAKRLAELDHLILICGRYEGIDERFVDECVDECVSLGDFVLTGGEIAAMAVIDAVGRLIPGVLADETAFIGESHWDGLLEHPQYTRPAEWHGRTVPEVLLSGNHAEIEKWRKVQSLQRTQKLRPDLWERYKRQRHD
ncbi:MAG: tRNA (guanosine(37)-N1)-methyltransferase TrmD [Oscillospiraceae bacterium]|nr:tRNA (guanosine(37)-N1)-methyltransferase TrmD [Oscillospiraceae bacterium]